MSEMGFENVFYLESKYKRLLCESEGTEGWGVAWIHQALPGTDQ